MSNFCHFDYWVASSFPVTDCQTSNFYLQYAHDMLTVSLKSENFHIIQSESQMSNVLLYGLVNLFMQKQYWMKFCGM